MLDCNFEVYRCGDFFSVKWLKQKELLMEGEYIGPQTGHPGNFKATMDYNSLAKDNKKPYVERMEFYTDFDSKLEEAVWKGVV
jgi:hypothetical protein